MAEDCDRVSHLDQQPDGGPNMLRQVGEQSFDQAAARPAEQKLLPFWVRLSGGTSRYESLTKIPGLRHRNQFNRADGLKQVLIDDEFPIAVWNLVET
jgi:hypothetical protein